MQLSKKLALPFLALTYLVITLGLPELIYSYGENASYIFELGLVILTCLILGRIELASYFKRPASLSLFGGVGFIGGTVAFIIAKKLGLTIPFDFNSSYQIVLLLLVAPILEELIFHFFIWASLSSFIKSKKLILLLTTAIFSYAHFNVYWQVEGELREFIIYQSLYTLFLGILCGRSIQKFSSVPGAITTHFFFNFGFFIASVVI